MNWLSVQTVAQISVERILNALPEGFLIALFAWALLRVLRRQNSGTRFAVWFLALLMVAALPVLGGIGAGQARMVAGMSSLMSAASSRGSLRPAITIPGRWALFVFLVWALGASVAMMRLLAGLWRLRQLRRSCTPIIAADLDPAARKTVEAIGASGSMISSHSIMIATSECVRVPAAIGFWKRTIVLPGWTLRELPAQDLNVILLHEFAHLRRWDDWTNLIQKIVRALFFFHPAVWWIEKRISVEREMACDDAVLAETANPRGYATCLVSLLEKSLAERRWSMAQAAVHRAREAALRLAQILDKNRPAATRVWKPALGIVGVFSICCLALLPLAPQFVAFDRGALASHSDPVAAAAVSPSSFEPLLPPSVNGPALATAGFETGESSSLGTTGKRAIAKVVHARVHAHDVAGHELASAGVVSAPLNAAPPPERVVETSASRDQETVPEFRTLIFIETTQYGNSDSAVWRVQVWRVMLVRTVRDTLTGVPAAHST
ncbi:MAG TPA: M56 family metallopeptidase [Terriglobales bacterium]|nr:M56 family metallopeptidase [Terriglobales bacterium]